MSTGNVGSGRVPEMWDLGEYQKGRIRASTGKVTSGRVPEMWDLGEYQKCGIWASTRNVGIRASTGKGRNPGEYRKGRNPGEMLENPKQAKRSKQTQGKVVGPSMTSRVYQQMTRISQKSNAIMTKEGGMPQYDNRKCHK